MLSARKKFRKKVPEFFRVFKKSSVAVPVFSLGRVLFAHGSSVAACFVRNFVFAVAAVFVICSVGVFSCIIFGHGFVLRSKNKFFRKIFSSGFIFCGIFLFIQKQK